VGSENGIEVARYFFPESFICMMSTVLLGRKSPCLASMIISRNGFFDQKIVVRTVAVLQFQYVGSILLLQCG
jgi:hypothetical protein